MRSRFALLLLTIPVACYAYACSSDDGETSDTRDAGTLGDDAGQTEPTPDADVPDTRAPDPWDGGTTDDGGDGGGPLAACFGNPLSPDGSAPDGGIFVDAAAAAPLTTIAGGFADGPQWVDALGGIVLSDFYQSRIDVLNDAGLSTLRQLTGVPVPATSPVGNAIHGDVIFSTTNALDAGGTNAILRTFPDGGTLPSFPVGQAVAPNDLVIGADGTIYYTDPRYPENLPNPTGVYRMQPDGGSPTRFAQYVNYERPNGIALNAEGTRLYVSLTEPGRIDYFPLQNGVPQAAVSFVAVSGLSDPPDGLAVDKAGNVYVAEANAGSYRGSVEVFDPSGKKWGAIVFPTRRPVGVAFGGSDDKRLYVTTEDAPTGTAKTSVFVFTSSCAGLR